MSDDVAAAINTNRAQIDYSEMPPDPAAHLLQSPLNRQQQQQYEQQIAEPNADVDVPVYGQTDRHGNVVRSYQRDRKVDTFWREEGLTKEDVKELNLSQQTTTPTQQEPTQKRHLDVPQQEEEFTTAAPATKSHFERAANTVNSIYDVQPHQYQTLALEAQEQLSDGKFDAYWNKLGKQYRDIHELGGFGEYDLDDSFTDFAHQMYGYEPAKVVAAMDFLGISPKPNQPMVGSLQTTNSEATPQEQVEFKQQVAAQFGVQPNSPKLELAFDLVAAYIDQMPDDVVSNLNGMSDLEAFNTVYRRVAHDRKRANKSMNAPRTQPKSTVQFTKAEIEAMSNQDYERNAAAILQAYKEGRVK